MTGHACGHHHPHHHDDERERHQDQRRLIGVLGITFAVCVAEFVGGYLTGSRSLRADAVHMFSDLLGQGLALLGVTWSRRAGAREHQRVEFRIALCQGALLLILAVSTVAAAALGAGHAAEVQARPMLLIAAVGLLANLVSAGMLHGGHSLNVRGAYLHVVMDGLSSVAVLVTAAALTYRPAWTRLDALTAAGIGLFIGYSAAALLRAAVAGLRRLRGHA